MTLRRDWDDANAAKRDEPCRVCGCFAVPWNGWCAGPIELAHVVDRNRDEIRHGPRGGRYAYVHPLSVVPLHRSMHRNYDAHSLDLWPHLTEAERAWAVDRVGEGEAKRRIRGRAWLESEAAA